MFENFISSFFEFLDFKEFYDKIKNIGDIMEDTKLIIKYQDRFICDKTYSEIDFIKVSSHIGSSDFYNIDIFVSLLCDNALSDSYEATKGYTYDDGLEIFEKFLPEFLIQVDFDIFLYDLDSALEVLTEDFTIQCENSLRKLPGNLVSYSYSELQDIQNRSNHLNIDRCDESIAFYYKSYGVFVSSRLLHILKSFCSARTDKDVLLLYSGGKDSALSAVRLRSLGYHVYFIHFDNGHMLDQDKPYLTFKNTFDQYDGYYFDYQNSAVDISNIFYKYFENWKKEYGDTLNDATLTSEVRCLSCRMAMYTKVFEFAFEHHFKYVAEGARISQKFMLEQQPMIDRLKDFASCYGIELLYPVLYLEDDKEEIIELLENGFSSKGWESKCLLGRKAKDKSVEDEQIILNYYDNVIKPQMVDNLEYSYKKCKL